MTNQQITLRVRDSHTFVEGRLDGEVYKGLKKVLGYKDDQAIWKMPKDKNGRPKGNWDGWQTTVCYSKHHCKCSIKKDGTHFPTGLLAKARDYFAGVNQSYGLIDERKLVERTNSFAMSSDFEVRDYQQKIITDACNKERGIIKMATGGGKTGVASGIIATLGVKPFIFYVTSVDLLKQAKAELEKFIRKDGQSLSVGTIGDGKCDIQDVNIMTVQTAVRSLGARFAKFDDEDSGSDKKAMSKSDKKDIAELIHSCHGYIADEVQHWAAKTCQVIADHSVNARFRYGLSATPWRDLGDDILIDACFGKPIADINASFLIEKKILVPPSIYFVHMPRLDMDGQYATVYKDAIVENDHRNVTIANIAEQMVDQGRQVLILCKHIAHGEILEGLISESFFIHGSHTSKQREDWLNKMRDKEAKITIATSIFDEGVDVKPLDGLILAGSGKSQTRALQRIGRVIRKYECHDTGFIKKDAFVVDFFDNVKYMRGHSMKRKHIYNTEPRFDVKDWKM